MLLGVRVTVLGTDPGSWRLFSFQGGGQQETLNTLSSEFESSVLFRGPFHVSMPPSARLRAVRERPASVQLRSYSKLV